MAKKKIERISRGKVTPEQREHEDGIRAQAKKDFPPKRNRKPLPLTGIPAQLRRARKAQGLTRYAVAKLAGIPNPNTIRDIEEGERDARLSNIEAVAKALGLNLELNEATS